MSIENGVNIAKSPEQMFDDADISRVLEIGTGGGRSAAPNTDGLMLERDSVDYFSVDLPNMMGRFGDTFELTTEEIANFQKLNFAYAEACALPFGSNTMDLALMRSLWGEYVRHNGEHGSNLWNLRFGVNELLRVVRPGGFVVIAEENTPEDMSYVAAEFEGLGFVKVTGEYSDMDFSEMPDDHPYKKLRGIFYGDEPISSGRSMFYGTPYVLVMQKPEDLVELDTFKADIVINSWAQSDARSTNRMAEYRDEDEVEVPEPIRATLTFSKPLEED